MSTRGTHTEGGSLGRRDSRRRSGRVYLGQRRAGGSVWDPVGGIRTRDPLRGGRMSCSLDGPAQPCPGAAHRRPCPGGDHVIMGGQMHPLGAPRRAGRTTAGRQAEHRRLLLLGDGLPGDSLHGNPAACGGGGVSIQADVIRAHGDPQVPVRRGADLRCTVPGSGKVLPPNSTSRRKARKGRDAAQRHEANGVGEGGDSPG